MAQEILQRAIEDLARGEDRPAEAAALAVDVLGRRVHDDIRAQLVGLLQQRRGEDIVHHQQRPGFMRDRGDGLDVDQPQAGVGRRFQEEQPGVVAHRGAPLVDVGAVHDGGFHPEARQQVFHDEAA